jgi:uncharacterized protein YecE (DUF72 family)
MDLRCGVAGWDYPDWRGTVYPARRPRGFDPLAYLSRYLGVIEINRTYYRPATRTEAASWLARIRSRENFTFTAKLPETFVRPGKTWVMRDVAEAREGLDLLHEHGRLAAALLQFAWSFKRLRKDGSEDEASRAWLLSVLDAFVGLPLFVELRHESWNVPQTFEVLRDRQVGWVNVDQPMLFAHSMPLTAIATTEVAYLRLHGRNYQSWGKGLGRKSKKAGEPKRPATKEARKASEAQKTARFDYLYREGELRELAGELETLAETPGVEHVISINNNHARGQAVVNALMLESLLEHRKVAAPPSLYQSYREVLEGFARPLEATRMDNLELPFEEQPGL